MSNCYLGNETCRRFEAKNLRRAKRMLTLESIGKALEKLKTIRDLLTGK
ncbi:MAG: hypothetical protein ACREEM_39635 [Blastocatellia bacterium]